MASLFLPPCWGVLVAAIKPQVGGGLIIYWAAHAWRANGVRGLARLLLPTCGVVGVSLAVYGAWFQSSNSLPSGLACFPWGVPVGVWLLARGIQTRRARWALASSPFFAPYVQFYSLAVLVLLADTRRQAMMIAAATWAVFGILYAA